MLRLAAIALAASTLLGVTQEANAPRVVSTSPTSGATGLDPASVKELRVEFDQPMLPRSFSFTGGGPTFPKLSGRPGFAGARTAVLPVELAPDSDYVVGVNTNRFTGFRSADGKRAAAPCSIVFSTREWPIDDAAKEGAVRALREVLPSAYSYASVSGVDWGARIDAFEPRLLGAASELEVAVLVQELVDVAGDPHVWTRAGASDLQIPSTWSARRGEGRDLSANIDRRGLSAEIERVGGTVTWHDAGVLTVRPAEGVGYLLVPTWDRSAKTGPASTRALATLADCDALIVDVRDNGGGDEMQARQLASRFAKERVPYAKRRSLVEGELGPATTSFLEPAPEKERFDGDVIVLIGPAVMSSNEAFALMMRACGARLVGETTLGSSGNPQPHDITDGVRLWLPSWVAMDAEGTPFEGVGIAPDVEVVLDRTRARREDGVLRRALELLGER